MRASYERGKRSCGSTKPDAEVGETLSILVVDDIEPVASLLREALIHYGHRADYAVSGQEALRIFTEREIDAVVSDLEMPEMDGWELGRRLKEVCRDRGTREPAFILLTGWGEEATPEDGMGLHEVDAILPKPVDIKTLLEAVRNARAANSDAEK